MMNHRRTSAVVLVGVLLSISTIPFAYGQEPDLPEMSDAAKAEMNAWMALRSPGEHHQHLAAHVGTWSSELTMWMEPGGGAMSETATSEVRSILDGRYIEWRHSGVFGGMPFEAHQIDAYNNGDQRYETTWIDNFGTLVLYFTGECDGEGKVRTLRTEFADPMGSGERISNRVVYTWQDDDHFLYESFVSRGGQEFKNMKIRYSRKQ